MHAVIIHYASSCLSYISDTPTGVNRFMTLVYVRRVWSSEQEPRAAIHMVIQYTMLRSFELLNDVSWYLRSISHASFYLARESFKTFILIVKNGLLDHILCCTNADWRCFQFARGYCLLLRRRMCPCHAGIPHSVCIFLLGIPSRCSLMQRV